MSTNTKLLDQLVRHADEYDELYCQAGLIATSKYYKEPASIQMRSAKFSELFGAKLEKENAISHGEEYVKFETEYAGRTFFCLVKKEELK